MLLPKTNSIKPIIEMGLIIFQNKLIVTQQGESVLSALLRENINVSFNCQQGICHSCLLVAEQGDVPSSAKNNLTEEQKDQGYFLACQCYMFKRIKIKMME